MVLKAKVIDGNGNATGDRELPEEMFGGDVNVALVHQVVTAQMAAARSGTASTKTRNEVRGGGQKPWRQKGTGRARHGSIRSPLWVGGGAVFGPKPRSYVKRVPKKMRKAALRAVLADKAGDGHVWILDGFDEPKTKAAARALGAAEIAGRVLVVLDPSDSNSTVVDRAFRNLHKTAFSLYGSLSAYDVLVADEIVFTAAAFERFTGADRPKSRSRLSEDDLVVEDAEAAPEGDEA
jgi:large subunit ribosomal protein L4